MKKPLFIVIPLVSAATLWFVLFNNKAETQNQPMNSHVQGDSVKVAEEKPEDPIIIATIAAVGDLMCHSTQFNFAQVGPDTFNFIPCFSEIRPVLASADFTIGNFETTLSGAKETYTGYPAFNTPDDFLDGLKYAGFDFLVTANNHSMDKGEKGALRTLDKLDEYGFDHTGTYRSPEDRDSVRVVDLNGISMAILNYTYGTNGNAVPAGKPWMINQIDTALIRKDIIEAKKLDSDLLMVFFHWGIENEHSPNKAQKMAAQVCMDNGVDLIIGAHPHVLQPVEMFKTKGGNLDSGLVAWSLGNFISNQYWRYTDAGVVMNIELSKDKEKDSVWISETSYVPTWVYRGRDPRKKIHIVLPAEKGLPDSSYWYINDELQGKMREACNDSKETFEKSCPIRFCPIDEWQDAYNERTKEIDLSTKSSQ